MTIKIDRMRNALYTISISAICMVLSHIVWKNMPESQTSSFEFMEVPVAQITVFAVLFIAAVILYINAMYVAISELVSSDNESPIPKIVISIGALILFYASLAFPLHMMFWN